MKGMKTPYIDWMKHDFDLMSKDGIEVLVSGEPLTDVCLISFGEGWVEQHVKNDKGVYLSDGNGNIQRRRVYGVVQLQQKPKAPLKDVIEAVLYVHLVDRAGGGADPGRLTQAIIETIYNPQEIEKLLSRIEDLKR